MLRVLAAAAAAGTTTILFPSGDTREEKPIRTTVPLRRIVRTTLLPTLDNSSRVADPTSDGLPLPCKYKKEEKNKKFPVAAQHIDRSSHFRCCALDASRPAAAAVVYTHTHTRASQINTHQRHRQIRERIKVSAALFLLLLFTIFQNIGHCISSVINQLNYDGRWNHVIVISGEIGSVVARSLCHVISFDEYFDRQSSTTVGILLFLLSIYYYHHYQKDNRIKMERGLCHELFQFVFFFFSVWLSMIKSRVVATTTNQPTSQEYWPTIYPVRPFFFLILS
jgi:hypothetical protein